MPLYKKCYEALMRRMILKNATVYAACGQKAGERLYGKKAFESKGVLLINGIQTAAFAYDEAARERVRRKHGLEGGTSGGRKKPEFPYQDDAKAPSAQAGSPLAHAWRGQRQANAGDADKSAWP